jgi:hypothetical protein
MFKLPTHSDFHDLFLNYSTCIISSPAAVALLYHVVHSNTFPYAQYFPVDLMDLLFNQEQKLYYSTLADLETSYHLLTSIYYKNFLNYST